MKCFDEMSKRKRSTLNEIATNKISTSTIRKMDLNYSSNIACCYHFLYMDFCIFKFLVMS